MKQFVNLTPHTVDFQLPDGQRMKFPASGKDARVDSAPSLSGEITVGGVSFPTITSPVQTDVYVGWKEAEEMKREAFPAQQEELIFIVSAMVLSHPALKGRTDVVAPATGPKDGAIRSPETLSDGSPNPRKGQIEAVIKWVTAPAN
jgi:hypothetical protein